MIIVGAILIIAFIYGLVTGQMGHWLFKAGLTLAVILVVGLFIALAIINTVTA